MKKRASRAPKTESSPGNARKIKNKLLFKDRVHDLISHLKYYKRFHPELDTYFRSGSGKNYLGNSGVSPTLDSLLLLRDMLVTAYDGNNDKVENDMLYLLGIRPRLSDLKPEDERENSKSPVNSKYFNSLAWITFFPEYLDSNEWKLTIANLRRGVDFFEKLVVDRLTVTEYIEQSPVPIDAVGINKEFRRSLWANALQIYNVDRNKRLEASIKEKYRLRDVIVAHLPLTRNGSFIDSQVIRTELVAQLAAHVILNDYPEATYFGVGSGYSLERFCFHAVTNHARNYEWIPLQVLKEHAISNEPRSSNGIATLLRSGYIDSEASVLPFIEYEDRHRIPEVVSESVHTAYSTTIASIALTTSRAWNRLTSLIFSVGGSAPRDRDEDNFLIGSDGEEYSFPSIHKLYEELEIDLKSHNKSISECAGVILGYFVNINGERVGSDRFQRENDKVVYSIPLHTLSKLVKDHLSRNWCLAAGKHKTTAVLAAIRGQYANCLVVDEEIATELMSETYQALNQLELPDFN